MNNTLAPTQHLFGRTAQPLGQANDVSPHIRILAGMPGEDSKAQERYTRLKAAQIPKTS